MAHTTGDCKARLVAFGNVRDEFLGNALGTLQILLMVWETLFAYIDWRSTVAIFKPGDFTATVQLEISQLEARKGGRISKDYGIESALDCKMVTPGEVHSELPIALSLPGECWGDRKQGVESKDFGYLLTPINPPCQQSTPNYSGVDGHYTTLTIKTLETTEAASKPAPPTSLIQGPGI
ncbi:hypothetical protein HOY80DRAFT_1108572 [Tuber brumale]|nr:hypothetical protein HOY80DRAFT_1108572 [Tuber brumale]